MKVGINMQTKEQALEKLRAALVGSMRTGSELVIVLDTILIDFLDEFNSDQFPSHLIFNREEWRKPENYMKVVREDEKYTVGGQNKGHFWMHENFHITFLGSFQHDDHCEEQYSKIPCCDQMLKITIIK